jgi:hypothetical protein
MSVLSSGSEFKPIEIFYAKKRKKDETVNEDELFDLWQTLSDKKKLKYIKKAEKLYDTSVQVIFV